MTLRPPIIGLLCGAALRLWMVLAWSLVDLLLYNNPQEVHMLGTIKVHEDYPCNQTIVAPPHATGLMRLPAPPPSPAPVYCRLLIGTRGAGRYRIRLTFNATWRAPNASAPCDEEYVHVGNSRYAVDIKSMTSYKFCGAEAPQEVVSRGRKLWVVYRSTGGLGAFSGMAIKYEVLPYASCDTNANNSYFRCSPVECVPYDLLCDGHAHCSNGRDEYCHGGPAAVDPGSEPPPLSPTHADQADPVAWSSPGPLGSVTCFLCADGTCIRPVLPVYHVSRGQPWWWLCDRYPHCRDGTDERMDVCMTMKSKSSALYRCPLGWSRGASHDGNVTAVLWRRLTCDTVPHCHGGHDERRDLCAPRTKTSGLLGARVYVLVVAVLVFVVTLTVVYHRDKCGRAFRQQQAGRGKVGRRPADKRDHVTPAPRPSRRPPGGAPCGKDRVPPTGGDTRRGHTAGGTARSAGGGTHGAKRGHTAGDKALPAGGSGGTTSEQHPNYFILSQTAV